MNVLMLGWELPPNISGGLGVASEGVAMGVSQLGHKVDFLLPKKQSKHKNTYFKILDASKIRIDFSVWRKKVGVTQIIRDTEVGQRLVPYLPAEIFEMAREKQIVVEKLEDKDESALLDKVPLSGEYRETLLSETSKYALLAAQHCLKNKYDLIHAHDWVTFKAGMMCARETGLPLYTHCHSTEYDRNGSYAQPDIIDAEQKGFEASHKIFCVSQVVKQTIIEKYKIAADKIVVVPNAVDQATTKPSKKSKKAQTIVFSGRFTHQKGPFLFVDIARDLINKGHDYQFKMIGDGYLMDALKHKVATLNLWDRFEFTGFLDRTKALDALKNADLLIAPSHSEPFGLVMLEAVTNQIPVLTTKGTGIAEFIPALVQLDHWDTYGFIQNANRILSDVTFRKKLTSECLSQAAALSWEKSAQMIEAAYTG